MPELDEAGEVRVALGANYVTDTALVTIDPMPHGLDLDPSVAVGKRRPGTRSGSCCARPPSGTSTSRPASCASACTTSPPGRTQVRAWVFLADSLENGAGYATHLGNPEQLPELLAEARDYRRDARSSRRHATSCDSSCYDCLRDYYNMAYHPLLDWRLARDLLVLLEGNPLDLTGWTELEASRAAGLANQCDGDAVLLDGGVRAVHASGRAIVVAHPLESQDIEGVPSERLAVAVADAEERYSVRVGAGLLIVDSFEVLRRGGEIVTAHLALA